VFGSELPEEPLHAAMDRASAAAAPIARSFLVFETRLDMWYLS
jgi:hypothetical protein